MSDITGYWNADGKAGIRAKTIILALNSFCSKTVNSITSIIKNAVGITHPFGRNETGINKIRLEKNLIGIPLNPNVYNVLVVGYDSSSTESYLRNLKSKTKKRIEYINVLELGTIDAIKEGCKLALDLVEEASEAKRESIDWSDLIVSVKCGGSDATSALASNPAVGYVVDKIIDLGSTVIFSETTEIIGAEHMLAKRAINDEVAKLIIQAAKNNEMQALLSGVDLVGTNPVPDNIKGGISTIEEKSLGAILKTGTKPINGFLEYAETPKFKGLFFMDSPSAATDVMTAMVSAGSQLILFSTGNGNPVGNPISPVIKITGNPKTINRVKYHIDVDISELLTGRITLEEAGNKIYNYMIRVINGKLTKSEIIGHEEIGLIPAGL